MKFRARTAAVLMLGVLLLAPPLNAQAPYRPAPGPGLPAGALSIAPGPQPYTLARACEWGKPLLTINVQVTNTGSLPLPAHPSRTAIVARDDLKPAWAGGAPLPALRPGASAAVAIPILPPWKPQRIGGQHRFIVTSSVFRTAAPAPIAVTIPAGACRTLPVVETKVVSLGQRYQVEDLKISRPGVIRPFGNPSSLPSPTGLKTTVDETECANHGGFGAAFACKAMLPQGRLVLVWEWNTRVALDGFRVYETDAGQKRIGTQANDATMFIIDPVPPGGYEQRCYAVSAYKGTDESDLSDQVCIGSGRVVQRALLEPPWPVRSISHFIAGATGANPCSFTGEGWVDGGSNLIAGFSYTTSKHWYGDCYYNEVYRLGLYFKIDRILHTNIRSAKLMLSVDTAWVGSDYHTDHHTSCVARIGTGTERWWDYDSWIDASVSLQPGEHVGPDVAYDVTPIVRQWATGTPNFGFVLLGEEENLGAFTEKACETKYFQYPVGKIRLVVEYY